MSSKPTDGPVSRYFNRRLSSPISTFIARKAPQISPNTLSWAIFLFSMTAPASIISGHLILGGLLVQAASILDGVDGEVARKLGKTSKLGAILDSVLDRIVNISIYIATMYYMVINSHYSPELIMVLGALALSGDFLVTYLHSKMKEIAGIHPALLPGIPNIASRDVRLLLIALLTIAGKILLAYILVAAITYTYIAGKILSYWQLSLVVENNKKGNNE